MQELAIVFARFALHLARGEGQAALRDALRRGPAARVGGIEQPVQQELADAGGQRAEQEEDVALAQGIALDGASPFTGRPGGAAQGTNKGLTHGKITCLSRCSRLTE